MASPISPPDFPAAALNPQSLTLTDDDISFLCDIGAYVPLDADAGKQRTLERMIASGLVEPMEGQETLAKYQLTGKAEKFLAARGVGLNES